MKTDPLSVIESKFQTLSKGQKLIANFMLQDYDKAAFMTANKLGKIVGVSESTVVRFANALGYEGYPDLQRVLQELIKMKLTSVQRMKITSNIDQSKIVEKVLKADIANLRSTIDQTDPEVFSAVVSKILSAKSIYVIGLRASACLAQFLAYYMGFLLPNIKMVYSGINDIVDQLVRIDSDDVLICISFPRYSNRTIEALDFVSKRGASIISITDSAASPLVKKSTHCLYAHSDMTSFVDSLVAPLSLINALIVAVSIMRREEAERNFESLEEIWNEFNVYMEKDKKQDTGHQSNESI